MSAANEQAWILLDNTSGKSESEGYWYYPQYSILLLLSQKAGPEALWKTWEGQNSWSQWSQWALVLFVAFFHSIRNFRENVKPGKEKCVFGKNFDFFSLRHLSCNIDNGWISSTLQCNRKSGFCRSTSAKPADRRSPQQRTSQVHREGSRTVEILKFTYKL